MGLDLFEETVQLAAELRQRALDYALVGGVALAVHGAPRATTDIDILVRPEDVPAVLEAARQRGFWIEAIPMRFSASGIEVRRVTKVEGAEMLVLDLLLVNPDLEPVWASRQEVASERGTLKVISRSSLIKMKALAGRDQDLADIRRLQELDG